MTGATGGLGGAILDKLYVSNANIIATGTNEGKLSKIKEKYKNILIKNLISDHPSIEKFVNDCGNHFQNKIDVWINNAGITRDNL